MSSYCDYIGQRAPATADEHLHYHDQQYGFPLHDDNELFGRLLLEINQAGLSWTLMLRKQESFRSAYSGFDIATVAAYGDEEVARLLADSGIIRNRLKVLAAIHNARVILHLQRSHGSFGAWLDAHHPAPLADWVRLFKKHFKFVGGEIVNEFLMSSGYLPGAHHSRCPVYPQVLAARPRWAESAAP
jgi:DNA-3-methyladenine glycosylase I